MFASVALLNLLPRTVLFKCRGDEERLTASRKHHDEKALAVAPVDAGKILERCAARNAQRIDLLLRHNLLGTLNTLAAFVRRDGRGFGPAILEFSDW